MGQQTVTVHALEYAPRATPGGVRIDRRDRVLTVHITLPFGRALRLGGMMLLLLLGAGGLGWLWLTADKATETGRVALGIFGALACLGGLVPLGKRLSMLWQPVTIQVTPQLVNITRRVGDRIGKDEWPRESIRGMRTVGAGWNEVLGREQRLELWFANGRGVVLFRGRTEAVEFLGRELGQALGLEVPATSGEKCRHGSRLRMARYPAALEFSFGGRFSLWHLLLLIPAAGLAMVIEWGILRPARSGVVADEGSWWAAGRITAIALVAWFGWIEATRRLVRRKVLTLLSGRVVRMELALRSPVREEFAAAQIRDFEVREIGRGRADLLARLLDGGVAIVVGDERSEDLQWVRGLLVKEFAGCAWFVGGT